MKLILALLIVLASCVSDSGGRSKAEPAVPAADTDEPMAMEVVPLQYAAAQEMAAALGNLLYEVGPGAQARIVADPRTNSLIVRAPREELPRILELIRRLDKKVE